MQGDEGLLFNQVLKVNAPTTTPKKVSPVVSRTPAPLQRSGNALYYGVAESHPSLAATVNKTWNDFTPTTNGPA